MGDTVSFIKYLVFVVAIVILEVPLAIAILKCHIDTGTKIEARFSTCTLIVLEQPFPAHLDHCKEKKKSANQQILLINDHNKMCSLHYCCGHYGSRIC